MKVGKLGKDTIAKYGHMFQSTGGNKIVELIERSDVNYYNNPIVCEMQGSCYSQVILLNLLRKQGLLRKPGSDDLNFLSEILEDLKEFGFVQGGKTSEMISDWINEMEEEKKIVGEGEK